MTRVLLVGFGEVGCKHFAVLKTMPRVRVVGVVEADPARASSVQGGRVFRDHRRALLETRPDVAVVATPPNVSLMIARDCAQYGCGVLVEKPVVLRPEALERSAEQGWAGRAFVAFQSHFAPGITDLLKNPPRSSVTRANVSLRCARDSDYYRGWRASHATAGGVLHQQAIHGLALAMRIVPSTDHVADVETATTHRRGFKEQEDRIESRVAFASGCELIITADVDSHAPARHTLEVELASRDRILVTGRNLEDLPERRGAVSNDTALLVGSSSCSTAELLAYTTEAYLASLDWTGSDIKALVVRRETDYTIAACVPALTGHFTRLSDYRDCLDSTGKILGELLREHLAGNIKIRLNTEPRRRDAEGAKAGYVTHSGSAVDYGEDGLVGRGNDRNGLIAPSRQSGNEALFGKNPVYHVGKVAGLLADRIAEVATDRGTGRCRASLIYHKGSAYTRPDWCELSTSRPLASQEAHDLVAGALDEPWLPELVDEERYLPRIQTLSSLLSLLRRSHD